MNKNLYLLDTSAFLTYLENEDGADTLEEILRKDSILIPAIVLLEIYYTSRRRQSFPLKEEYFFQVIVWRFFPTFKMNPLI